MSHPFPPLLAAVLAAVIAFHLESDARAYPGPVPGVGVDGGTAAGAAGSGAPTAGAAPAPAVTPPAPPPAVAPPPEPPAAAPWPAPPSPPATAIPPPPPPPPPSNGLPAPLPPGDATMVQEPTPQKMGKAKKKKGDKGDKPGDKPGEWAAAGPLAADGVHTTLGTFEVRGRVYARAELQRREVITVNSMAMPVMTDISSLDLSVPTARVSLRYRAPAPWLTAEVEVDLAGRPEMKDGYVQAKWKHLQLRAGQFKMPVSSLEMASPWTLPFVRRGFMTDLLVDRLDIAGRRPGATVTLRGGGDIAPRLVLGAFQGSVVTEENADGTRKTELVEATSLRSQSLVARGQIEVAGMEIGAWYEHRVGTPAILMIDRYWTAGADLALDWVFGSGGLRIWADALAGASWFEHADKPADGDDATFVSARALVAYRFGGVEPESPYLEIYGLGGGLDPDADVVDDIALEAVLGVNVGLWRRARLSLQGEWNQAGRNFPASYYLGRNPDRIGLLLQAAVAF